MQILTTTTRASAIFAEQSRNIASHIAAAAHNANAQVQTLIAMSNDDLAAWLNAQDQSSIFGLFEAHGQLGDTLNSARDTITSILEASGIPLNIPEVDVRTVAEKLADQGRQIISTSPWVIADIPEPEPEPEPEPVLEPEP